MSATNKQALLSLVYLHSGATTTEIAKIARMSKRSAANHLVYLAKMQRVRREKQRQRCRWFFLSFDPAPQLFEHAELERAHWAVLDALLFRKNQTHAMRGRV